MLIWWRNDTCKALQHDSLDNPVQLEEDFRMVIIARMPSLAGGWGKYGQRLRQLESDRLSWPIKNFVGISEQFHDLHRLDYW